MIYNNNDLSIPVILSNGNKINMMVKPYEATVDNNGYVRFFSMQFNDGVVGNFKLLPNNNTKSVILNFCADFLTPIGISYAGRELINHKNEIVTNIGRHMFSHYTTPPIQNFFRDWDINDSAYYEITTGEKIINHPVKLRLIN